MKEKGRPRRKYLSDDEFSFNSSQNNQSEEDLSDVLRK